MLKYIQKAKIKPQGWVLEKGFLGIIKKDGDGKNCIEILTAVPCSGEDKRKNKRRKGMEIKLELNMKCEKCSAINFAVPYAEKDTRRCFRCGGALKELTVDLKEDGEDTDVPNEPSKPNEPSDEKPSELC